MAVLIVVLPLTPDATTGPTTHVVACPTSSGSVNVHDAVLTVRSVTPIVLRTSPPVFTMVNL